MHNIQMFMNCFVIIHYILPKVSTRRNKCIIFEPNVLSITLSTIWSHRRNRDTEYLHYTLFAHVIQVTSDDTSSHTQSYFARGVSKEVFGVSFVKIIIIYINEYFNFIYFEIIQ